MADARNRYRRTANDAGAWKLPYVVGEVWNIPTKDECPEGEVRFDMTQRGPWGIITRLTALVIDWEGEVGTVYGVRTMSWPRESGYQMEGWVSVQGAKRKAFTSSRLFEREDGSLVSVAVFILIDRKKRQ